MTAGLLMLLDFLRSAWSALVWTMFLIGLVGLLVQVVRAASSAATGARHFLADAAGTAAGVGVVLLVGFTAVPVIVDNLYAEVAHAGEWVCEPLVDLGIVAVRLVGALAALRMLLAFARSAAMAAVGGRRGAAAAFGEAGEVVAGMLVALLPGPMVAHFLGIC